MFTVKKQYHSSHQSLPVLQIPLDAARHVRTYKYTQTENSVPSAINRLLADHKDRQVLLLTAYFSWMYRLSGEKELAAGIEGKSGTLFPLKLSLENIHTFEALEELIRNQLAGIPEQSENFEEEALQTDTFFLCHSGFPENEEKGPIISWLVRVNTKGKFSILIRYDASLLSPDSVKRFSSYFLTLLQAAGNRPDQRINSVDILTDEDLNMYQKLNRTETPYPENQTIHGMFEQAASRFPEHLALASQQEEYTYAALNRRANQIAHLLLEKEVRKGDFVTIFMDRSLETIISLLGIMKAGGVYVPVDPDHPEERNSYIVEDTRSAFILTKQIYADKARHLSTPITSVKEIVPIDSKDLDNYPADNPGVHVDPDDLAYIIYTSGSTGKPKGALIAHRGVVNLGFVVKEQCGISEREVLTQFATYSFDASVWDTIGALFFGAKLYLLSAEERVSVEEFADAIERTGTTIITILPTVFFNQLATYLSDEGYTKLKKVKLITVAGEALYGELVRSVQRKFGEHIEIINVYGPTECTVCTTTHKISGYLPEDLANVPIGKPIDNYKIYIVNEDHQLCPLNVPGEIYISTVGLAKGYLNQPEKTRQSFIPSPFALNELIYKSGDIARLLKNGTVEYVGRRDSQIKIRGHRIEIGEIEDNFAKYPDVQDVAVIPKKEPDGQNMLVAYFTSKDQDKLPLSKVKQFLSDRLPSYFIPKYLCQLNQLPLSPTGKIDRKKLAGFPHEDAFDKDRNYVAPQTEPQRLIAKAWEEVLNKKPIGLTDDFFDIGGDSLDVLHVLALLKPRFTKLRINDFFTYKTVEQLAERAEDLMEETQGRKNAASFTNITDLDEHPLYLKNSAGTLKYGVPKHVLLTGATGYLGSHLLYELLTKTDAVIYPIVRKTSAGTGRSRLQDILKLYFGEAVLGLAKNRVKVMEGDLEAPGLGLPGENLSLLRQHIDTIVHSAADVRHFGDAAQFEKTNIFATKHLADLAMFKKGIRFHHISTMGIPEDLALSGQWETVLRKEEFDPDLRVENVYTQSKLEAEKLLFKASKQGAAITIYRAGNLSCHSESGRFQRNIDSNAFYRMIKAMLLLEKAPEVNWHVDFTPVDFASEAIVHLASQPDTANRIFHICHPEPIRYEQLLGMIRACGYNVETMAFDEYTNWLLDSSIPKETEALQLAMAQLEGDGAKDSAYRYGCKETTAFLNRGRVRCKPVDQAFIQKMILHAVEVGYFPKPRITNK
ncbi:non-ribosomal peptide synthetase [Paenibacillus larvae]|nr:non-ribosomal peptide synthetase [Paenibacillus larvae]AQR78428.1 peptide synthetase [Paenibacillus larvae subsp. larvae]AVF20333.1 amino acid adenylation protein [Paenibacillus larvae subsp. larvae]AVG10942.1 amino acid adenylation protein [Paenibacillus larvae subsp. larvae DSM 25430]ETK28737.1 amino acid adenylation protein [Paenibacillus larvae subsp. larvae DSM 25719]MCY7490557.1 amino acid adenylation domain-containing protein [Paenibacillus larvae]